MLRHRQALRVRGKLMFQLPTDPDALVVRVIDLPDAQARASRAAGRLLSRRPTTRAMRLLVRLDVVEREELAELLEDAWGLPGAEAGPNHLRRYPLFRGLEGDGRRFRERRSRSSR